MDDHIARAHSNFCERAIRTVKDMFYRRVEADEQKRENRTSNGQTT